MDVLEEEPALAKKKKTTKKNRASVYTISYAESAFSDGEMDELRRDRNRTSLMYSGKKTSHRHLHHRHHRRSTALKSWVCDHSGDCPSLGILRLDYNYPPAPGDIDSPHSFDYPVFYRVVPGLTFDMCKSGKLTPQVAKDFDEAVEWLDMEKGVSAITGDCGFMIQLQSRARKVTKKPVFISAMMQLQAVLWAFHNGTIIVMTADSDSLKPMKKELRKECGIELKNKKLVVAGCQNVPHFGEQVRRGEKVDVALAEPGIVKTALKALKEHPDAKAILMECTELPPYSSAVRHATGLPVFDAITNCNFVMDAYLESARFGKTDWYTPWDGVQESYVLGREIRPSARDRMVTKLDNF